MSHLRDTVVLTERQCARTGADLARVRGAGLDDNVAVFDAVATAAPSLIPRL
jgi:hypothetical protein